MAPFHDLKYVHCCKLCFTNITFIRRIKSPTNVCNMFVQSVPNRTKKKDCILAAFPSFKI